MTGKTNGVLVQADVAEDWEVLYYEGRNQPWTLGHELSYQNDRSHGRWRNAEVIKFCETLGEAEARSRMAL